MVSQNRIAELRGYDQLSGQKAIGNIFHQYYEAPITFSPTYKFDPGTNRYDTSEKRRTPSWTDRILIRADGYYPDEESESHSDEDDHPRKTIYLRESQRNTAREKIMGGSRRRQSHSSLHYRVLTYTSSPLTTSDHRPVLALVQINAVEINRPLRHLIIKAIQKQKAIETGTSGGGGGLLRPTTGQLINVDDANGSPSPSTDSLSTAATAKVKLYHKKPPPPPPPSNKLRKPSSSSSSPAPSTPPVSTSVSTQVAGKVTLPPPSSDTALWWNNSSSAASISAAEVTFDPLSYNPFRDSALAFEKAKREASLALPKAAAAPEKLPDYLDDIFENHSDDLDTWEPMSPHTPL
ncbi:hypothetical protein BJ085DRAFT_40324 [Dimargaris cristalligena]|uniref:Inositol polyphosphate-related phosphatase domain-containing protein n=1 Tax=Dimargaris cristalligena TaxID=215637 RepID=A0A4P9ZL56_9FUNG|nr:hypothetical protein BJ085DRAFT_40324 [Dimargaris cristalligena]|eukprot:RKP33211.1 hypothetical protein BJ085DRAFT_40324 [Dimargaris cristalligena]